jgi:malate permease and related proteins
MVLATAVGDLLFQFGGIFYLIVLPMLLLSGLGFALQRAFQLDLRTLTRLNFFFVIPAMIYFAVVSASISAAEVGQMVLFCVVMVLLLAAVALIAARLRRVPPDLRNAMVLTAISYNSGNYGLPLQELAFKEAGQADRGMSLQSFVMLTQNLMNFTLGVLLAASGRKDRHWRQNLLHLAKFPPLYALAAALLTVQIRRWLGGDGQPAGVARAFAPFWQVILYVKSAFVAVALFTLGAQLAAVRRTANDFPVKLSVFLRLLLGPAIGLGLVLLFGARGLLGQVMLISTSTPTAVNAMLLCMEFDNHPNYVARCVFYSTLLSPVTVTLVVFLAQSGLVIPPG